MKKTNIEKELSALAAAEGVARKAIEDLSALRGRMDQYRKDADMKKRQMGAVDNAFIESVATSRLKLEASEYLIPELQGKIVEAGQSLSVALDAAGQALIAAGQDEREAVILAATDRLRPFAGIRTDALNGEKVDEARTLAEQLPCLGSIPAFQSSLGVWYFTSRGIADAERQVASFLDNLTMFNGHVAEWKNRGCRFLEVPLK